MSNEPTGRFQLGVGYGTDVGFFAHAHLSQSNVFGTGDLLALDASVSSLRDLFQLRLVVPHWLDSDFSLDTKLYDDRRTLPGFTRVADGGTVALSRTLAPHLTAFVGYRLERVSGEADAGAVAQADPTLLARVEDPGLAPRTGWISALRAGAAYSTLDTPIMPLHGTSAGFSIEEADPRFGSTFQLTRVNAWLETHQPLGPVTLHVGGTFNMIESSDALGVPLTERLFLDGSSQIRGFAPGALGPIDPLTGMPIGGNVLFTGHVELEAPIATRVGLSVDGFYDAGGIFDRTGAGQFGQSTGFGGSGGHRSAHSISTSRSRSIAPARHGSYSGSARRSSRSNSARACSSTASRSARRCRRTAALAAAASSRRSCCRSRTP